MHDDRYSTTRSLTTEKPACFDTPVDGLTTLLKTPDSDQKIAEGGLRLQGFFKTSSEDKPLITVVTVVYNGAKFLEDTIKSVIEQTYDNVEYIIVDGGSTDGTLDIIQKYQHAIDYWVCEPDKGIYDAMNKGANIASLNSWILFLGADDVALDLSSVSQTVLNDRSIGCVIADVKQYSYSQMPDYIYKCWIPDMSNIEKDFFSFPLHHQGFFYKKWKKNIPFIVNVGVHSDYDQMLRVLYEFKAKKLNNAVSCYRTGGASDQFSIKNILSFFRVAKNNSVNIVSSISKNKSNVLKLVIKSLLPNYVITKYRARRRPLVLR